MKKVFYSEVLDKYFDSKEECLEEERKHEEVEQAKVKAKETRAEDAKKVEEAFRATVEARKKASEIIQGANQLIDEADKAYYEARKEFVEKYGSYHMTYSNKDGVKQIIIGSSLFDVVKDIFRIDCDN